MIRRKLQLPFLFFVLIFAACGPSQPPATPDFTAAIPTANSVQLAWSSVSNASSYSLERGQGAAPITWSSILLPNATSTAVTDSGLTPNTTYTYRVKAANGAGSSYFTNKTISTKATPQAPANFTATPTDTTVALAWDAVGSATQYRLQRGDGASPSDFSDLTLPTPTATSFSDSGLTIGATYTYRVQAITPDGEGAFAIKSVSLSNKPAPPTGFTVKDYSTVSVRLGWGAVTGASKYELERGTGASPSTWAAQTLSSPTATEFNNTGLTIGSTFSYRLRVTTANGLSDWTTLSYTVGAPLNFRVVTSGLTISHVALAWDSLSGVTQYKLERIASAGATSGTALTLSSPTALAFTDTGLAAATTYYYRLAAGTAAGFGPWVVVNGTTLPNTLTAPVLQTPTVGAARAVSLTWSVSTGATGYTLQRFAGPNTTTTPTVVALSGPTAATDTVPADGTYTYRVRGTAGSNTGPWSDPQTVTVPGGGTAPAAPVLQTPTVGAARAVSLTWSTSAGATSYTLQRFTGPDNTTTPTTVTLPTPTSTSVSDTVPADGTYTYQVYASANSLNSTPSNSKTVTVTTAATAPNPPTNFNAVAQNSVSVKLTWTASSGATGYTIERGDGGAPSTWTVLSSPTSSPYTDTTARPKATHTYRIKANNAAGSSTYVTDGVTMGSPTIELLTTLVDIPWSINFAPDGRLLFTPRNQTSMKIHSIRPADFTGSLLPITDYTASGIAVRREGEAGILGMDLDPNFASNNRVYICYSYTASGTALNRVSRFVLSGTTLTNEVKLLEGIGGGVYHNGCRVLIANNYLFITMGDGGNPSEAQIQTGNRGRMFRINLDGTFPASNPFTGAGSDTGKATWAYGMRNAQGLVLQPGTNVLWTTEHGDRTRDEVNNYNTASGGKNYGWPHCAGTQAFGTVVVSSLDGTFNCNTASSATLTASSYVPAVREYSGGEGDTIAPSDMVFYPTTSTAFSAWQGNLFFVTLKTGRLYRMTLNGSTISNGQGEIIFNPVTIAGLDQRLRDITVGPDGFFYLSTDQGNIFRLKP